MSGTIFYNEIDATNLGYSDKRSAIVGNLKLGLNINLTNSTIMQFNTNYRLSELTPQGKYLPGYGINAGLRQDLFGKKAALILMVSDVFNTLRWKSETDTPVLFQTTTSKRKSQIVYLGFTYRFGKANKKTIEDLKFDEQK